MNHNQHMSVLKNRFSAFLIISLLCLVTLIGCDEQPVNFFTPSDYSTVPAPFDTTTAFRVLDLGNGLRSHVIFPGIGQDTVTMNDRIEILYTGRFSDGEIFDSSYRDGLSRPLASALTSLIPGFAYGTVGCRLNEKRTIVVPPEYGYSDFTTARNTGRLLRGEVLIFDIELVSILK
jgi:FKBP-type peptidyl-prolyl cis-trans isomerase FkpA